MIGPESEKDEAYLWDRSGSDAEVERLEALLRPLRWQGGPRAATHPGTTAEGPRASAASLPPPTPRPAQPRALGRRGPWRAAIALAAAVVAAAALGVWWRAGVDAKIRPDTGYVVTTAEGASEVCAPGEAFTCATETTIDLGSLGTVRASPEARLRVLAIEEDLHKLRLEEGTIEARIAGWARPRLFQVETPVTTCVDLGCAYTLTVAPDGASLVRVTLGQVAFVDGDREVFVPSGARCRAEPGRGSGTPVFEDAPLPFALAVAAYDGAPEDRREGAALLLAAACTRRRDTLSLWHLLAAREPLVRAAAVRGLLRHEEAGDSAWTQAQWRAALESAW